MIVDTMTFSEVANELLIDWCTYGINKKDGMIDRKKCRKAILSRGKNGEAQYFSKLEFVSKRNNSFVMLPYSNGRSQYKKKGLQLMVFSIFRYQGRMMVARIMNNYTVICLFEGHVFKRYNERYANTDTLITKEGVIDFFKNNLLMQNRQQILEREDSDVFCMIPDGILFGKMLNPRTVLYKTFITKEMAKGKQIELMKVVDEYQKNRFLEVLGRPIKTVA